MNFRLRNYVIVHTAGPKSGSGTTGRVVTDEVRRHVTLLGSAARRQDVVLGFYGQWKPSMPGELMSTVTTPGGYRCSSSVSRIDMPVNSARGRAQYRAWQVSGLP